jgi:hypothetical protein
MGDESRSCRLQTISLKNESPKRVRLTAIPLIEYTARDSSYADFVYTVRSIAVPSVIHTREKAITVIDMLITLEFSIYQ